MCFVPFQLFAPQFLLSKGQLSDFWTDLVTSNPPATPLHQDDTLIDAVFCFGFITGLC